MYENVMRAWVHDLRTTKTLQGHSFLSMIRDGKFYDCAMGRLCKLALASKVEIEVSKHDLPSEKAQAIRFEDDMTYMPDRVKKWANLRDVSGFFSLPLCYDEGGAINQMMREWVNVDPVNRRVAFSIDALNDDGLTFPQLADLIEYFWDIL